MANFETPAASPGALSFIFGGDTNQSYEQLQRRRKRTEAMAAQIMGRQPKNVAEGFAALAAGIGAGISNYRTDKALGALDDERDALRKRLYAGVTGLPYGQEGLFDKSSSASASANLPTPGAADEIFASNPASGNGSYRDAIASIESAGSGDYSAIGPTNDKLGRPLGRYQIMESNVPSWSKEALGREVSPEEFLKNPELQDRVFDHKFQGYVNQYGPEGAAQAWIGGPGSVGKTNRKDVLGTSVGEYGRRFMGALGPQQVASLDPRAGMQAPQSAAQAIETQAPMQGGSLSDEVSDWRQTPEAQAQFPGRQVQAGAQAFDVTRFGAPALTGLEAGLRSQAAAYGATSQQPNPGRIGDQSALSQEHPVRAQLQSGRASQASAYAAPTAGQPQPNPAMAPAAPQEALQVAQAPMQGAMSPNYFPPAPQAPSARQQPSQSGQAAFDPGWLQLMTDPGASEADRALAGLMVQRQMDSQDPSKQMDMQYRQAQIEALKAKPEKAWARLDDNTLFNPETGETKAVPLDPNRPSSDLGLNPQYGVDANGEPVLLQLGKDGRTVQSKMPEGVSLSKQPIKLDAGTHFVLLDPITRQPVGQIPKDIAGEASATVEGKAAGEARANLGQMEDTSNQVLSTIDSLNNDPYLDSMVGSVQGRLPNFSSDAARVQGKMDQVGGQQFLQAFNSLRGAGQITEVEGAKATKAIASLGTAQSEADYRKALADLRGVVETGMARARSKAGGAVPSASPMQPGISPPSVPATPRDPLAAAREAIGRGAPREAVIERLRQSGINPEGL